MTCVASACRRMPHACDASYRFTGVQVHAKPWTPALLEIKRTVEEATGEQFNFCLVNLCEPTHTVAGARTCSTSVDHACAAGTETAKTTSATTQTTSVIW